MFRGAVTLYMIITGIVYNLLLAPASADVNTNTQWVNFIVHVLGPIVVTADWFAYRSPIKPTVGQMATWWIFPALYLIYTMIRGPFADWYPYPFLDPNQKGVGEIVLYCVGILVAFVVISIILRWWSGPPRRQRRAAARHGVSGGQPEPGTGGEIGVEDRPILLVGDRHVPGGGQLGGRLVDAPEAGQRSRPRLVGVGEVEVAQSGRLRRASSSARRGAARARRARARRGRGTISHAARAACSGRRPAARRQWWAAA